MAWDTDKVGEIIIDGIKYDTIREDFFEFYLIVSTAEAKDILEIYSSRREVPAYYGGHHRSIRIIDIEEIEHRRGEHALLIKISQQ